MSFQFLKVKVGPKYNKLNSKWRNKFHPIIRISFRTKNINWQSIIKLNVFVGDANTKEATTWNESQLIFEISEKKSTQLTVKINIEFAGIGKLI